MLLKKISRFSQVKQIPKEKSAAYTFIWANSENKRRMSIFAIQIKVRSLPNMSLASASPVKQDIALLKNTVKMPEVDKTLWS